MEFERHYYEDLNYHPFLFYAIFGVKDGAVAVLDLLTFILFSAEEWTKKIFEPGFTPYSHTVILA